MIIVAVEYFAIWNFRVHARAGARTKSAEYRRLRKLSDSLVYKRTIKSETARVFRHGTLNSSRARMAGHFHGAGSLVVAFLLYDSYLRTYYIPTLCNREGAMRKRKGEDEKCARDTFRSHFDRLSRFDDAELELPQIEMGAKGLKGRPDGIAQDTNSRAIAKNCREPCVLLVADIWISTRETRRVNCYQQRHATSIGRVNQKFLDFLRHLRSQGSEQLRDNFKN